jgi:hypothetical protein
MQQVMLDLQPLVVWYSAEPYSLSNIPPGRHRLMVELVNNDHSSLSPAVVQELEFDRLPRALPNTGEVEPSAALAWLLVAAGVLVGAGVLVRARARSPH